MDCEVLNEDQVQHFTDRGYLVIKGCIEPELAQRPCGTSAYHLGGI
jgi:hypothetical protein